MDAPQTAIEETVTRIRKFAMDRKLLPGTLARRAGLHPNTLRDMQEPSWRPRFDTIKKLEEFIQAELAGPDQAAASAAATFSGSKPHLVHTDTVSALAAAAVPDTIAEIADEIPPLPPLVSGVAISGR